MPKNLKNRVMDFFNTLLTGYGWFFFCGSAKSGFFFLIASFLCPYAGLTGLAGALISFILSYTLAMDIAYIRSGIFICNGALIGIALGIFLEPHPLIFLFLIPCCFLSNALMKFYINTLGKRYDLPAISLSFVIISWIAIIVGKSFFPPSFHLFSIYHPLLENISNYPAFAPIIIIFKMIGATIFQVNPLTGIICLIGILSYSRILFLFSFIGAVLTYALFTFMGIHPDDYIYYAFNCIIIAGAIGGVLIRLNIYSAALSVIMIAPGAFFSILLHDTLVKIHIPLLAAPLNFILISTLFIVKVFFPQNKKIKPIALYDVKSPDCYCLKRRKGDYEQKTILSLPFLGTWYVSQGNGGRTTHFDNGFYAWDFIVTDDNRQSFRELGLDVSDYFAFGLPVISPADGRVIRVENNIEDNRPKKESKDNIPGNYIMIDHGNCEYSEISHFKYQSILVKAGDYVERGQILGLCGNSGKSLEPHIHIQLQNADYLGGETLPARFSNYIIAMPDRERKMKLGIPRENEMVRAVLD